MNGKVRANDKTVWGFPTQTSVQAGAKAPTSPYAPVSENYSACLADCRELWYMKNLLVTPDKAGMAESYAWLLNCTAGCG